MSKRDVGWLNTAAKIAENSNCRHRHGAIIVRGGSVISVGINQQKNHPSIVDADNTPWHCGDHAEIAALKRATNARGATIYIARVRKDGKTGLSKPCSNCAKALDTAGIKKVYWTT